MSAWEANKAKGPRARDSTWTHGGTADAAGCFRRSAATSALGVNIHPSTKEM